MVNMGGNMKLIKNKQEVTKMNETLKVLATALLVMQQHLLQPQLQEKKTMYTG